MVEQKNVTVHMTTAKGTVVILRLQFLHLRFQGNLKKCHFKDKASWVGELIDLFDFIIIH